MSRTSDHLALLVEMTVLSFENDGVELRKALLSPALMESVKLDIDLESPELRRHGVRNLEKRFSSIAKLANDTGILSVARDLLAGSPSLVRALFFDKTPKKNWSVAWHQDRTVTLNRRIDARGWGPWSIKEGVHHVQPPLAVLDKMVTLRLHIDPADADNGCLEVIPGSHLCGLLSQADINRLVLASNAIPCVVGAGDAVVMRPHVLHRSRRARRPHHRRVVHLEFSSFELPCEAAWA